MSEDEDVVRREDEVSATSIYLLWWGLRVCNFTVVRGSAIQFLLAFVNDVVFYIRGTLSQASKGQPHVLRKGVNRHLLLKGCNRPLPIIQIHIHPLTKRDTTTSHRAPSP